MLVFKVNAGNVGTVSGGKRSGKSVRGEAQDVRDARIDRFWQNPINAILIPVGKLFAESDHQGGILADHIASGASFGIPEVNADGITLYARPQVFSLATMDLEGEWGCLGCGSAHGSGVTPSKGKPKSKGLATNLFYYRPYDGAVFTISKSCWDEYVRDRGMATDARFCDVRAYLRQGGKLLSPSDFAVEALTGAVADAVTALGADADADAVAESIADAVADRVADTVSIDAVSAMSDDAILAMADAVVADASARKKGGKR